MKNYSILALAIMALCTGTTAEARYSGGTGEPNDPYRIATPQDLNDIGKYEEDWDKHFVLINDVNLAGYTGTQFNRIGNSTTMFTGIFDGNDHKVWSFTWSSTGRNYIGLFGCVGSGGQIKNLGIENVNVNAVGGWYVGSLVGYNLGTITNCYSTGKVSETQYYCVGGLVGSNRGTITDCYFSGSVSGYGAVGGIAGLNDYYGTITYSHSIGNVSGDGDIGGLVGDNWYGMITNCYFSGSVSAASWSSYVAGLVGDNQHGTIIDCYSTASVAGGRSWTAGLVACNLDGIIRNCYSKGNVSGRSYVGGLVGQNGDYRNTIGGFDVGPGWVYNSYSTANVSGQSYVGGLVGQNGDYGEAIGVFFVPGSVYNCYSTGNAGGTEYVGGLVGYAYCSTINSSYSSGKVLGNKYVGGLVGGHIIKEVKGSFWDIETSGQAISDGGTPKTTAEMKTIDTFTEAGWDFVEIWGIGENQMYPFLLTEPAGDLDHDKKVDLVDLAILASHWLEE